MGPIYVSLSILLAILFAATGASKVLGARWTRESTAHLGISPALTRAIGVAEIAAAAGLIVGLWVRPLAVVTAACVVLLMVGAVGVHLRARDSLKAVAPAVVTALVAAATLTLAVGR